MELQQISLENICENTVWTLTNFSINHILREINLYQIFEDLISRKKKSQISAFFGENQSIAWVLLYFMFFTLVLVLFLTAECRILEFDIAKINVEISAKDRHPLNV